MAGWHDTTGVSKSGGAERSGVGSRFFIKGALWARTKAFSLQNAPTLLLLAAASLLVATCSPGESFGVPERPPSVVVLEPDPERDHKVYTWVLASLYDEWERFQASGKEWPVGNRIMSVNGGTIDPIPEAIISLFKYGVQIMSPEDALRAVLNVGASHGTTYYADRNAMFEHVKEVLDYRWDEHFADDYSLAYGDCPGGRIVGEEFKAKVKWIGPIRRIDASGSSSHASGSPAYKSINQDVRVYDGGYPVYEGAGLGSSHKCDYNKVQANSGTILRFSGPTEICVQVDADHSTSGDGEEGESDFRSTEDRECEQVPPRGVLRQSD